MSHDVNQCCQGFFNVVKSGSTIKNVNLKNVKISSREGKMIAGIVGYIPKLGSGKNPLDYTTTIENCSVEGLIQIDAMTDTGAILGRAESGAGSVHIKDCKVIGDKGSYIEASVEGYRSFVGGIVGSLYQGGGDNLVENCVVKNMELRAHCEDIGGIAGFIDGGTVKDCTVENCKITNNYVTDNKDAVCKLNIGALVGSFSSERTSCSRKLTLEGNTVSNIEIHMDGDWLDCMNSVGQYVPNDECAAYVAGSKVVDGVKIPNFKAFGVVGQFLQAPRVNPDNNVIVSDSELGAMLRNIKFYNNIEG